MLLKTHVNMFAQRQKLNRIKQSYIKYEMKNF